MTDDAIRHPYRESAFFDEPERVSKDRFEYVVHDANDCPACTSKDECMTWQVRQPGRRIVVKEGGVWRSHKLCPIGGVHGHMYCNPTNRTVTRRVGCGMRWIYKMMGTVKVESEPFKEEP